MARLVVYVRSQGSRDVERWRQWLAANPVACVEIDIDADPDARARVVAWTGLEAVPTLVIATDRGVTPVKPPDPLPPERDPRAIDRGTMLTQPKAEQIPPFLLRHGIAVGAVEQGWERDPAEMEREPWTAVAAIGAAALAILADWLL